MSKKLSSCIVWPTALKDQKILAFSEFWNRFWQAFFRVHNLDLMMYTVLVLHDQMAWKCIAWSITFIDKKNEQFSGFW